MTEYEIKQSQYRCAVSGRELTPGEVVFSLLRETPEGFERLDFAEETWTGPDDDCVGFWKFKVPEAHDKDKPKPIDDSAILEFFERIDDERDSTKENFKYILALLLLRRKMLKFADVVYNENGTEVLVLRKAGTNDRYEVVNPGLSESQLAEVQAEVTAILQSPGS